MRRLISLLLGVVLLSGCTTMPSPAPTASTVSPALIAQRASLAIDDLVRLNAAAQRAVAIFLPWLSPDRAARVRAAAALVDAAIARVALARDPVTQAAAIAEARTAIAGYKWLAGA